MKLHPKDIDIYKYTTKYNIFNVFDTRTIFFPLFVLEFSMYKNLNEIDVIFQ